MLNGVSNANIKLVADIADVPRSLPNLVLPDLSLFSGWSVRAVAIGILGLVNSAGVSQTFLNPGWEIFGCFPRFFSQGAANLATASLAAFPAGAPIQARRSWSVLELARWANIFGGIAVASLVLLFANLVELVARRPGLFVIVAGVQMVNVTAIQTVWQTNTFPHRHADDLCLHPDHAAPVRRVFCVMISILLVVFQQSNTLRVVEWETQQTGWSVERFPPTQLESGKVTVLYIYGHLSHAAADLFEKSLPAINGANRACGDPALAGLRRYWQHGDRGNTQVHTGPTRQ